MNKRLIGKLVLAALLLTFLYAFHYGAQKDLKKEIGRGYHVNVVNIATVLNRLDYEALTELSTEPKTFGSVYNLHRILRYSEMQLYSSESEVYLLLSNINMLLMDYENDGMLSTEDQEKFDTSIRKIIFIIDSLEQILGSDFAWYEAFTDPSEKLQQRLQEQLDKEGYGEVSF